MYMATARVFTAPDQPININQQGQANPSAVRISGDQNVKFSNNSGSTISIVFAQTAISHQTVFNDINGLASGANYSEGPLVSDITVNYNVTMNGQTEGPFAIEVGTGQLEISVTGGAPMPDIAAIPPNGEIQFNSTDEKYGITWQKGDPFTPPLNDVFVGQNNNKVGKENGRLGDFDYALAPSVGPVQASKMQPAGGGGTIKVT
jgi:hypothetical protein